MESNGIKGRIHCSQSTADALVQAGKSHWLTRREDKIVAKGKGEMQTYWVNTTSVVGVGGSPTSYPAMTAEPTTSMADTSRSDDVAPTTTNVVGNVSDKARDDDIKVPTEEEDAGYLDDRHPQPHHRPPYPDIPSDSDFSRDCGSKRKLAKGTIASYCG